MFCCHWVKWWLYKQLKRYDILWLDYDKPDWPNPIFWKLDSSITDKYVVGE